MIGNIILGQYIPGKSFLHRADPRTKLILIIVFMVSIFYAKTLFGFVFFGIFILFVLVSSDIPLLYTLRGLKPIILILVFTALINMFTIPGTVILDLGFMSISREGIIIAVQLAARLTILVIVASILTLTTTPIALTDGIERLMKPLESFNVPVHEIAMMMSIALRFIPTLIEETDRIMKAQASRGADFDTGNIMQKAKSFIPVLIPLFVSAFKRADELAEAMESRCYRGSAGRTRMKQLRFTRVDLYIAIISVGFLVVFIVGQSLIK